MSERPPREYKRNSRAGPTTEWSDERLVRECLNGNEDAWSGLIDKYKNLIYSIPAKNGTPPDISGEIFQQVCFELLTALPNLKEAKSLRAWLITITSRKCFDWRRRERRYQPFGDEQEEEIPEQSKASDALVLELEREQILRETLPEIAPRCRTLIRMLFLDSPTLPYEQVASSLGLATGSIGFIRMRCLRKLRRLLEEKGFK